jgi:hypothetical protein
MCGETASPGRRGPGVAREGWKLSAYPQSPAQVNGLLGALEERAEPRGAAPFLNALHALGDAGNALPYGVYA